MSVLVIRIDGKRVITKRSCQLKTNGRELTNNYKVSLIKKLNSLDRKPNS